MSKILFVDDDAVIVEIYRKKLLQIGYQVEVAQDGLAAMSALVRFRPDLVVLDIMMPKFSGQEVLEFIRSQPQLKHTRVIVLSNFFCSDADRAAVLAKADENLLKSDCSPTRLVAVISNLLSSAADATPGQTARAATQAQLTPTPTTAAEAVKLAQNQTKEPVDPGARSEFLKNGPATLATLRQFNDAFVQSSSPEKQVQRLTDFYRKVHFVTAMAGLAGCEQIAMLSSAFEALLLELHEKPASINPSALQTIAYTLDFFRLLFAHEERGPTAVPAKPKALVVDDDPISNRAIVRALYRANLHAVACQDSLSALKTLETAQFDLLLLDIQMPGMDGFELCKKVRALPGYRTSPVIFVTSQDDFKSRAHSILSGGNDLITKPIFPIELAVKAVTHLLRSQLPEEWMRS